jgi:uncharacterized membrane protein
MQSVEKVSVFILSLVFLCCAPLHIYSAFTQNGHHTESHTKDACTLTLIDKQFAHFHEMTSALLFTLLVLVLSIVLFAYFVRRKLAYAFPILWVPILFYENFLSRTKGALYWLKIHTTSPPSFAYQ